MKCVQTCEFVNRNASRKKKKKQITTVTQINAV